MRVKVLEDYQCDYIVTVNNEKHYCISMFREVAVKWMKELKKEMKGNKDWYNVDWIKGREVTPFYYINNNPNDPEYFKY
jgi:hypothetical protein|tara:strand:+ start:17 stop:253 length:237 start_codon:yes stop_codon:yes gene_type:complete